MLRNGPPLPFGGPYVDPLLPNSIPADPQTPCLGLSYQPLGTLAKSTGSPDPTEIH